MCDAESTLETKVSSGRTVLGIFFTSVVFCEQRFLHEKEIV